MPHRHWTLNHENRENAHIERPRPSKPRLCVRDPTTAIQISMAVVSPTIWLVDKCVKLSKWNVHTPNICFGGCASLGRATSGGRSSSILQIEMAGKYVIGLKWREIWPANSSVFIGIFLIACKIYWFLGIILGIFPDHRNDGKTSLSIISVIWKYPENYPEKSIDFACNQENTDKYRRICRPYFAPF